jgi:hypothetical protein
MPHTAARCHPMLLVYYNSSAWTAHDTQSFPLSSYAVSLS